MSDREHLTIPDDLRLPERFALTGESLNTSSSCEAAFVIVAIDKALEDEVVIKARHDRALMQGGLEVEAEVLSKLAHPNIPRLRSTGLHDGMPWIAIDRVPGRQQDQDRIIRYGAPTHVARRMLVALDVLGHVHERNIQHNDIKPENLIFRPDGGVGLIDFEFCVEDIRGYLFGHINYITGTTDYLAPERIKGDLGDTRADLYSLSAAFYKILYGQVPFANAGDEVKVMMAHLYDSPSFRPKGGQRKPVPAGLEAIIRRGLEKDPDDRYDSTHEMSEAIQRWMSSKAIRTQLAA